MPIVSESRFRVRYAETDQMGVVYYANFLVWMEIGRTDFCRACGFTYAKLERETECYLAVAEANCRYISPAYYDDEILVETRLGRTGRRVVVFDYSILNAETRTPVAKGQTVHVTVGRDGKPKSLPDKFYQRLII